MERVWTSEWNKDTLTDEIHARIVPIYLRIVSMGIIEY